MENLLTPVHTAYKRLDHASVDALVAVGQPVHVEENANSQPKTPEEALNTLRNKPSLQNLSSALRYLEQDAPLESGFRITSPSPIAAQIINVLVSEILPSYWSTLNDRTEMKQNHIKYGSQRKLLLSCFRNVAGLKALALRSKALIQSLDEANKAVGGPNEVEFLTDLIDVLEALLDGEDVIQKIWDGLTQETPLQQKALWRELVALVGGGKILNNAAEALSYINDRTEHIERARWIGDGRLYSSWLGRNIKYWSKNLTPELQISWKNLSELLSKSLRLGYPDTIIGEILTLIASSESDRTTLSHLVDSLSPSDQRTIVIAALNLLSKKHQAENIPDDVSTWWKDDSLWVSAAARYLDCVVGKEEAKKGHLINWLTSLSGAGVGESVGIRRAALAVLSQSKLDLEMILEKSIQQFGDQLYIRHAPTLQQEVHTQVLLLAAGYVHRKAPLRLSMMLRSGPYLAGITNRLSASSDRARILGMIVGEALSGLVEKPDKRMNFKMDELESPDAKWYKSLVFVQDKIGSLELLKTAALSEQPKKPKRNKFEASHKSTTAETQSKIVAIEELEDDEDEEDNDLVPYAKPDTDEEDSDDDPTLVERNKPTAPVYVRDLITYLRDTENFDRQRLGLQTAYSLIRRKANFGTEVTAHDEELATILVGLQDKYDLDDFQDLRLQGMIAILISNPSKMGKWFAKTFFSGDYSLSQRISILTVLSMSARELAGLKDQTTDLTVARMLPPNSFPSKTLPPKLHALYTEPSPPNQKQLLLSSSRKETNQIDSLSTVLSKTLLQPLATSLSSSVSGPPILQINKTTVRAARPPKAAVSTNSLLPYAASSFFFPLTAHFRTSTSLPITRNRTLLPPLVKTLTLIYHAAGRLVAELYQMTSEFFDFLLSLRSRAPGDKATAEAIMLGLLTILEVVDKRTLAERWGRELGETESWVQGVLQGMRGGSEEDDKVRAIAAGVLVRVGEVVEGYRGLLIGEYAGL